MNNKIKYSHIDYILIRMDVWDGVNDISLYSFNSLKMARSFAEKDITNEMKNRGIVYSPTNNNEVYYEDTYGNDYWFWTNNDNITISWEIRKVHHRTTSKWNNPTSGGDSWIKEEE